LTSIRYHAEIVVGQKAGKSLLPLRPSECEVAMDASVFSRAKAEVIERHGFFRRWLTEGSAGPEEWERCEQAFDAEFSMVTPDGSVHGLAEVLERLRKAQGSMEWRLEIAVEEITPLWLRTNAALIGYVEAQSIGPRRTRRRSSALFEGRASAPNGVVWRHLHETWVETRVSSRGEEGRQRKERHQ